MKTWQDYAYPAIEKWEAFAAKPYLCPANKWTIGYGTTKYPDGRAVGPHDPAITEAQAVEYMAASAQRVYRSLLPLIHVACAAWEWGALVILAYNIGVGTHDAVKGDLADSTLIAKLNRGDRAGAADQFMVWNKIHKDGQVVALNGLTARRAEERKMFLGGV